MILTDTTHLFARADKSWPRLKSISVPFKITGFTTFSALTAPSGKAVTLYVPRRSYAGENGPELLLFECMPRSGESSAAKRGVSTEVKLGLGCGNSTEM